MTREFVAKHLRKRGFKTYTNINGEFVAEKNGYTFIGTHNKVYEQLKIKKR